MHLVSTISWRFPNCRMKGCCHWSSLLLTSTDSLFHPCLFLFKYAPDELFPVESGVMYPGSIVPNNNCVFICDTGSHPTCYVPRHKSYHIVSLSCVYIPQL